MLEEKMLKFVSRERKMPEKRDSEERKHDFDEIYQRFLPEQAEDQSARCSQCGVPFCQLHCPLHNNIPDWLRMVSEGRMKEAYRLSSQTNIFPEICGRICPQDRLCEGSCVIEQSGHGTVTIGSVEQYITEHAWDQGWVDSLRPQKHGKGNSKNQSVGIIGAGPAGLSAAADLCRLGYKIEIYDAWDRPGGLLIYGIPNFKLDKKIVQRRMDWLHEGGIVFNQNCVVGEDISFESLRKKHDVVLIATGTYKARLLDIAKEYPEGVIAALDYLVASNRKGLGDHPNDFEVGSLNAKGRHIAVIGGGDTAMDCLRTAVRQGALSVRCFYRRDRANMPGSVREVANAEAEGVIFHWLSAPKSFQSDKGHICGIEIQNMRLGGVDASGRKQPIAISGDVEPHTVDMILLAMGFEAEDLPQQFKEKTLERTAWGTVKAAYPSMLTSLSGVFAAGDIVRGASLVVWAIREGCDAAAGIHEFLQRQAASQCGLK